MKNIILIAGVLIIIAGGFFLFRSDEPKEGDLTLGVPAPNEERIVISGHSIPGETIIPVGTTVIFENKDSFAGLPYDQHTITTGSIDPAGEKGLAGVVPNSGSGESDGLIEIPLLQDEEFSFLFGEVGTYTFYIAEHPTVSGIGKITVIPVNEAIVGGDVVIMESGTFFFSPNTIQANVGEKVVIDINSVGQHTFTVDEFDVNVITPNRKTTRVEFIPDKKGTFEFYCSVPGHRGAGQVGTLIVE